MVNSDFVSDFGLEVKYAPLGRSDGQGNSVIDGYASLFGVPDQNGDVVEKGAFQTSLKRLKDAGRSVKLLWQHDPTQPIGVWDKVYEDDIGLKVKGRLITEVAKGAEGAALMAAGAIDGLSIGYKTIRSEKEGAGRRLIELDLWEVSLVTFPMLPEARAQASAPDPEAEIARALSEALFDARSALS